MGLLDLLRKTPEPVVDTRTHRGRIWRDGAYWCYHCQDCDYGAAGTRGVWSWLLGTARNHTDPQHWSRNCGY